MPPQDSWHLDKRVPIPVFGAMLVQTVVAVWYFSSWSTHVDETLNSLTTRLEFNERTNRRQYDIINEDRINAQATARSLARLEGLMASIEGQMKTIVNHVLDSKKGK